MYLCTLFKKSCELADYWLQGEPKYYVKKIKIGEGAGLKTLCAVLLGSLHAFMFYNIMYVRFLISSPPTES